MTKIYSDRAKRARAREFKEFLRRAVGRGDIFKMEDGYYYYNASSGDGAYSEDILLAIAEHLMTMNKSWDRKIRRDHTVWKTQAFLQKLNPFKRKPRHTNDEF